MTVIGPAPLSGGVKHLPMRPEMRKPILVVVLLVVVGCVVAAWLGLASRSAVPYPPTLSFAGREPGLTYVAAGFYVTNCGRQAIMMRQVRVQTAGSGGWKTLSERPPQVSLVLEPGAAQINFSPVLEAGQHRKVVVQWPEEQPWRVCLIYAPELKGLKLLGARVRLAWRLRNTPSFRGSVWRSRLWGGPERVINKEVTH